MNKSILALALLALGQGAFAADVAADSGSAYWRNSSGQHWRSSDGNCVRSGSWNQSVSVPECDKAADTPMLPVIEQQIPHVQLEAPLMAEKLRLEGEVHFAFDKADLSAQGKLVLDDLLAKSMAGTSRIEIAAVGGHADRIGESFYNHDLAMRRALAVGKYLVAHGVPESKLDMREFGQSQPRVACDGMKGSGLIECLAPNRRAEVVIVVSRESN